MKNFHGQMIRQNMKLIISDLKGEKKGKVSFPTQLPISIKYRKTKSTLFYRNDAFFPHTNFLGPRAVFPSKEMACNLYKHFRFHNDIIIL